MVQGLLDSKSKVALLGLLLERPHAFSVSELGRLAGIPKATVSLIVKDWEKTGLVLVEQQGRNKLVRINQRFYLLPSLRAIFDGSRNFHKPLFAKAKSLAALKAPQVLAVVAFGSRVRKDFSHASDLDVLIVVKNKNSPQVEKISRAFAGLTTANGVLFSPVFMDKKEAQTRRKEHDSFLLNVLKDGKILKGAVWLGNL